MEWTVLHRAHASVLGRTLLTKFKDISTDALERELVKRKAADQERECTGEGNCHGCLKWCVQCGDVSEMCDYGCDYHCITENCDDDRCRQHSITEGA